MASPTADAKATPGRKKGESKIDPNETDRQRFTRIAELRTGNAMESIRRLAPLGNKSQYKYEEEDVNKIETALTNAVKATIDALRSGKPSASTFKL